MICVDRTAILRHCPLFENTIASDMFSDGQETCDSHLQTALAQDESEERVGSPIRPKEMLPSTEH